MGNAIDKIDEGLYLGNKVGSSHKEFLEENGITHILNVCYEPCKFEKDYTYLHIPYYDSPHAFMLENFQKFYAFISEALSEKNNNVFVHCAAGVSRSGTVVVSYLMKSRNWGFETAFNYVKTKRSVVQPKVFFQRQLNLWKDLNYELEGTTSHHKVYDQLKLINNVFKCFGPIEKPISETSQRFEAALQMIDHLANQENGLIDEQTEVKLRLLVEQENKDLDKLIEKSTKERIWPDFTINDFKQDNFYLNFVFPFIQFAK
ncbi:dual specificity protein phosphatase -related [Anaeramoeba flamelloides]|uniref:Dual specificity protein phosphatase -related n=1 Tax=Anaeramoeba flamelloides TaxID=1746091 RepID=A0ABQ8XLQ5_9EUKA|nr:dual specificity protein phosphatase -related [Anaeramoeba flamelloides]